MGHNFCVGQASHQAFDMGKASADWLLRNGQFGPKAHHNSGRGGVGSHPTTAVTT